MDADLKLIEDDDCVDWDQIINEIPLMMNQDKTLLDEPDVGTVADEQAKGDG